MATLRLYLDTRSTMRDGSHALKVRITVKSNNAMIPLEVRLKAENWDADKQLVKGLKNKDSLNNYISHQFMDIQDAMMALKLQGRLKNLSAVAVRDCIVRYMAGEELEDNKVLYSTYYNRYLAEKKGTGTYASYIASLNHLKAYDSNFDNLPFHDIDRAWINGFVDYLREADVSTNTIITYVKNVRAVWNVARSEGVTEAYPFFRMRLKVTPTRKRNLPVNELKELFALQLDKDKQIYLDVFKLMFCLIGINTKDLYSLPVDAIKDGRVGYQRAKTHKIYSIKVEPEAMDIINRYKGKEHLLFFADEISLKLFEHRLYVALGSIREGLTSYYSRHSWATIAAKIGITKDVIAQALGHGNNTVTDIYIEFDMAKADDANRRVLDYVFKS